MDYNSDTCLFLYQCVTHTFKIIAPFCLMFMKVTIKSRVSSLLLPVKCHQLPVPQVGQIETFIWSIPILFSKKRPLIIASGLYCTSHLLDTTGRQHLLLWYAT